MTTSPSPLRQAFERRMKLGGITDLSEDRFAQFTKDAKACTTTPSDIPCLGCPDCMGIATDLPPETTRPRRTGRLTKTTTHGVQVTLKFDGEDTTVLMRSLNSWRASVPDELVGHIIFGEYFVPAAALRTIGYSPETMRTLAELIELAHAERTTTEPTDTSNAKDGTP